MYAREKMNMKFRHIALMLAATLWISCGGSGDEPEGDPVSKDRPIVFSGMLSEGKSENHARTRDGGSTVPLQEFPSVEHGHTTFHVWSYKTKKDNSLDEVMKNYTVNWTGSAGSTTSNSSGWEYVNQGSTPQDIKYWDFSVEDYRIFGYSGSINILKEVTYTYPSGESELTSEPESVTLTCTVDAESEEIVNSSWPLFSKLWYKSGSAIAASVQPVTLEFLRPVARVRFIFTFIEGISFRRGDLYDIEFSPTNGSNVAKDGTFSVTYPLKGSETEETWKSSPTGYYGNIDLAIDYYEDPGPTVSPQNSNPETYPNSPEHWYYVLPRRGTGNDGQGSYTLTVTVGGGEPKTTVVPAAYMTWEPGHDYTYVFKITSSGGVSLDQVKVAINSWNVKASVKHPVYNW